MAVRANGQYFNAHFLEFIIFDSDRCQFGRSDKGKVTWVEADDNPLAFIIG
jgi:hypothetical protein